MAGRPSQASTAVVEAGPPPELGTISGEQLWDNLEYFLARVLPVAEEAGVRLAMHPDGPPISPLGGIFFVHFRDVEGTVEKFVETWHDAGPTDMRACTRPFAASGSTA